MPASMPSISIGRSSKCGCPIRVGNSQSGDQRKHNSRIGDRVRQNHVFGVDEDKRDDGGDKDQIERQSEGQTIAPDNRNPEKRGERFNCRISRRNVYFA